MKETKKYWKGLEQLNNTEDFQKYSNKEFPEYLPTIGEGEEPSRRDFLKLMGFGVAAVSLAACETPVKKAIPYVKKPDTADPSIPNYYASTYVSGNDYCSVVVKTREGRPIKIEGNKLSSVSGGGTTPQVEASVLSLYDENRLRAPQNGGIKTSWEDIDNEVINALSSGKKITLVSYSIFSPTTLAAIEQLIAKYPNVELVTYDPVSFSGTLDAYETAFGDRALPSIDFSKAETIVSFGADFLGAWPNRTLTNKQFAASRKLGDNKKVMSRLYAFESNLSLTGANADYRVLIKPSEEITYLSSLYNELAAKKGSALISSVGTPANAEKLKKAAKDLLNSKSSVVLSGTNDRDVQLLVVAINDLLGNYKITIDTAKAVKLRTGSDTKFNSFVDDLKSGSGVIFLNCNPVYDHSRGSEISSSLSKSNFSVSTSIFPDETSSLTKLQAPDHHYLESWNDFEPVTGFMSLSQPSISKIFDTRQLGSSILAWSGSEMDYYDFLRKNWETKVFPTSNQSDFYNFDAFWDKCLHDGVYAIKSSEKSVASPSVSVSSLSLPKSKAGDLELVLYQNNTVADGTMANNPWLQEMPEPITKATWDNYLTVSPRQAEEWGIELGDMSTQTVNLTVNGKTVEVPVMPQPGQTYGTVGLAIGYGRTSAGKVADGVGVDAYQFIKNDNGVTSLVITSGVQVEKVGNTYRIGQTQTSQTYMGRETVIQESILSKYKKDPQAGRHFPRIATSEGFKKPNAVSLWSGHEYPNHHWGLMVDLNSCTGCGTCTIACQTENNIPVVGKQEVLNRREMHWIRIDRYYSTDATEGNDMEIASENPEVTFQPMMCQQCNNAPCETVCPVAATTHSSEGLNQMTYNRCIGTRYCANNCPYKVRRFNWFKYHDNKQFDKNTSMNNDLGKMVLNPDVTVRARGVMEKCTFCVQRIQAGKLEAKRENRRPIDGEFTSACASSCPSEALVFGDMKNPNSQISQMLKIKQGDKMVEAEEPRAYHVLEELRVMPNVWYLTKIRNKDENPKKEAEAVDAHA
ncbi:MAG: TAT-variant-translocated molybdopterin oxidoreductase [Cyclobacteriaceae bacterium]